MHWGMEKHTHVLRHGNSYACTEAWKDKYAGTETWKMMHTQALGPGTKGQPLDRFSSCCASRVCDIYAHVCRLIPADNCARNHPFLITRHLYVNLARDLFLWTSCIRLKLQDLFGAKSVIICDRLKIVFEACTYLLRFGGCRRFLAGLIDRHLVEK